MTLSKLTQIRSLSTHLSRTVQDIKALGKRVGVVINPATPASVLEEILQDGSQVLVMTVNPASDISISCSLAFPRLHVSAR